MLFSIHASASCALYAYAVVAAASAGNRSSVATSVTEMFYQPYHRPPALSNPPPHTVLPGLSLPLEPFARHDRPRRVEDVLRLQYVLVHRREQQRRARVVEVRDDLVLHARHALPLRVTSLRRSAGRGACRPAQGFHSCYSSCSCQGTVSQKRRVVRAFSISP